MKLAPLFKTSDDMKKSIFDELTSQGSKAALPSIYDEDRVIGMRLDYQPDEVSVRVGELAEKLDWIDEKALKELEGEFT